MIQLTQVNSDLVAEKLDIFFSKYRVTHYKKGEIILRAQEVPQGIVYLKNGYVRVFSISKTGEELTLIIFKPNDLFPVMWAVNNAPNEYFVEALTSCELWIAPRQQFLVFIKTHADVYFDLMSKMMVRFGGLMRRMEYLVFGNAANKVASILLILAERFGIKLAKSTKIDVPLTHQDIASLVGVTRETASIEMKKLEKRNMIAYRNRQLFIKNLKGLKKESALEV